MSTQDNEKNKRLHETIADLGQPVSLADELRKLIEKWRGLRKSGDAFLSVSAYGTYEMAADELSALLDQHAVAEPQVCEKTMHMYVWTRQPFFVAVAQAENVERAREALLEEIGTSYDGSCPEREAADKWVRENTPSIWHQRNAEFALTDSAELREQEDYSNKLQKKLDELKAAHAAEQPKLSAEQVHVVVQWLHFRMCVAQNLPYEDGDTCEDCEESVREILQKITLLTSPVAPPPHVTVSTGAPAGVAPPSWAKPKWDEGAFHRAQLAESFVPDYDEPPVAPGEQPPPSGWLQALQQAELKPQPPLSTQSCPKPPGEQPSLSQESCVAVHERNDAAPPAQERASDDDRYNVIGCAGGAHCVCQDGWGHKK